MSKHSQKKSDHDLSRRSSQRVNSVREITISYEGRDEIMVVKPPNLSTGGMFINTSQNFPEGSVLNLRFELLLTGVQIETRCEVRYCQPKVGVGVQFIGLSKEATRAIERELVRYREDVTPRNPRRHKAKREASVAARPSRTVRPRAAS
ncbi:MAG: PilZ domain-containing protein [Acidobacteria bacterium]|nr:PilZ domain-containing protein [Acidobacteriota bacterium]